MFHSLEFENFKAFGKRVHIPLAPITLLFGQNSSGKSSVLQALNLLKQTRESRESGAILLPRTEKGIVDLGSFQDLIYNHDLSRFLKIRIICKPSIKKYQLMALHGINIELKNLLVGYEVSFSRPSVSEEIIVSTLDIFLNNIHKPIAKYKYTDTVKIEPNRRLRLYGYFRVDTRIPKNITSAKCTYISSDNWLWDKIYTLYCENSNVIVNKLNSLVNKLDSNDTIDLFKSFYDINLKDLKTKENIHNSILTAIDFYSSKFSISKFIKRMISTYSDHYILMDGYTPLFNDTDIFIPEIYAAWESDFKFENMPPDIGELSLFVGSVVNEQVKKLIPLGPLRRPPERLYIFTGTSPHDVGYKGELLPDLLYRNDAYVRSTNKWLKRLGIGYRIKVRSIGKRERDWFEVQLIDTTRYGNVKVGLADVGYGISQILPFIVQCIAGKEQILSIEQPEVHIHPRLQADLGDLLIESIQGGNKNQFIIETHSEHIILRLLRRIRETFYKELPKGVSPLRPKDLSIIFVQRGSEGAEVIHIPVSKRGEFEIPWPEGFFPERAEELF